MHKQIIVIDISETKDDLLVLVNPEIVGRGRGGVRGGLFVRQVITTITRAARITVRAGMSAATDQADRGETSPSAYSTRMDQIGRCLSTTCKWVKRARIKAGAKKQRLAVGPRVLPVSR